MNNKTKGLVSTLICTYNAEKFIKGTLESVLEQTYDNQEILIWDDGSTDKTIEIIKKYIEKGYKIKIWTSKDEGKKLGPYGGLNFLIDKSKGEFIAIQDHDDIWYPKKLEKQVSFMNNNIDYIGCGTGTLMYFGKSKMGYIYTDEERTSRVIHTSLLFRDIGKKYIEDSLLYLSDGLFMQTILTEGKKILYTIPDILTLHYYKEDGNNLSENWSGLSYKKFKRYFDVYGFSIFSLFNNLYLTFKIVLIPYKIQKWITYNISLKNRLLNLEELNKKNNCKKMINYLNN